MLTYLRRRERPIPVTCVHFGARTPILRRTRDTFIKYQLHTEGLRAPRS